MKKETIFRKLYENKVERDNYIDSVPLDIRDAIYDNLYSDLLIRDCEMMMKIVFEEHTSSVEWFLYDWEPGFKCDEVKIMDIDQYIEYLKMNEGFE